MLFKDVKIDAEVLRKVAEKWCADWKPFALYYLRNKKFVTVRDAYEDFEDQYSYITKERECDHCGSMYEAEDEESNPTIHVSEMITLFNDLRDPGVAEWIEKADEIGLDWYEQEVTLTWIAERDWTYKNLWFIHQTYADGSVAPLGDGFDSRAACIARIEDRVRYGYAYRYTITDPEGGTETFDHRPKWKAFRVQPSGLKDGPCSFDTELEAIAYVNDMKSTLAPGQEYHIESPNGTSYMAASHPAAPRITADYTLRTEGAIPYGCGHPDCGATATHTWSNGALDAPDYLCAEHLPLYTKEATTHVE